MIQIIFHIRPKSIRIRVRFITKAGRGVFDRYNIVNGTDLKSASEKVKNLKWCERGELNPYGFLHWILSL